MLRRCGLFFFSLHWWLDLSCLFLHHLYECWFSLGQFSLIWLCRMEINVLCILSFNRLCCYLGHNSWSLTVHLERVIIPDALPYVILLPLSVMIAAAVAHFIILDNVGPVAQACHFPTAVVVQDDSVECLTVEHFLTLELLWYFRVDPCTASIVVPIWLLVQRDRHASSDTFWMRSFRNLFTRPGLERDHLLSSGGISYDRFWLRSCLSLPIRIEPLDCVMLPLSLQYVTLLILCHGEAQTHRFLRLEKVKPLLETCHLISTLVV